MGRGSWAFAACRNGTAALDTVVSAAIAELIVYTFFDFNAQSLPEVTRHAITASVRCCAVALLRFSCAIARLLRCRSVDYAAAPFLCSRATVRRLRCHAVALLLRGRAGVALLRCCCAVALSRRCALWERVFAPAHRSWAVA